MRSQYLPFGRPNFSDPEIEAVARVMRTGWVGTGPETVAFEKELQSYVGASHVVTVNSCTSALFLSLLVSEIGSGDEVICPSLTWCSTADVGIHLGARIVFCDVDPDSMCVTAETILDKVTSRTKAVMVVHMGGLAVDVAALRRKLPPHIAIIEDGAHAIGAKYPDGSPVGSAGNLTCFSFYANKNLSTGDGGAIALQDEATAERLRSLRQQGMSANAWKRFRDAHIALLPPKSELGYKMNYTDLQACIGRIQLRRQPELSEIRLGVARVYLKRLPEMRKTVRWQPGLGSRTHARHLFVIRVPVDELRLSRDELLLELRSRNVGASVHYPPLHAMAVYGSSGQLPHTEVLSREILTLPISASMTHEDAHYVMDQLAGLL